MGAPLLPLLKITQLLNLKILRIEILKLKNKIKIEF